MGLFGRLFGNKGADTHRNAIAEVSAVTDQKEFPQGMRPLDPQQSAMIACWLKQVPVFLERYGDRTIGDELQNCDQAFAVWRAAGAREPSRDEVISWLGAYLGNRLVSDHHMQWVMVADQYGEEIGVRHDSLEMVAFPFDSVIKRTESDEYGFIASIYQAVGDGIAEGGARRRQNNHGG